jgi:hypothetical protein
MTLYQLISQVQSTNPYFKKDLEKARYATKFIGRGSTASSTNKYMVAAGNLANCGIYSQDDIIFVSAEGMRGGRIPVDISELEKAVSAKATFVTDDEYNRNRPYNLGEREVANFLIKNGYIDTGKGIWKFEN